MIFKGHKLTIGLDLGDRWSFYCVLDEAGQVILEQKLPTTPEAMKQALRNRTALQVRRRRKWLISPSLRCTCISTLTYLVNAGH